MIYCIDPGTEKSGVIVIDGDGNPNGPGCVAENAAVITALRLSTEEEIAHVVIERFMARGLRIPQDCIDTAEWAGRFWEAAQTGVTRIPRRDVLWAMCGSMKGNDTAVKMAIVDRFGGKDKAIGKKKTPGPLYGIKDHVWSALAVGLTYLEQLKEKP